MENRPAWQVWDEGRAERGKEAAAAAGGGRAEQLLRRPAAAPPANSRLAACCAPRAAWVPCTLKAQASQEGAAAEPRAAASAGAVRRGSLKRGSKLAPPAAGGARGRPGAGAWSQARLLPRQHSKQALAHLEPRRPNAGRMLLHGLTAAAAATRVQRQAERSTWLITATAASQPPRPWLQAQSSYTTPHHCAAAALGSLTDAGVLAARRRRARARARCARPPPAPAAR